jgi:hypothetical protein
MQVAANNMPFEISKFHIKSLDAVFKKSLLPA